MVSCTQKYSTSQYVLIHTMIYNVYLSIFFNIQGISGYILAWDIAKGTHCTPEQLSLPFHTPKGCQGSVHSMCLQDMIELCWSPTGTGFRQPISFVGKPQLILQVFPNPLSQLCRQPAQGPLHKILQKPTDIYYLNKVYTRVCTLHICVHTPIYCDIQTYTT